jgi:hypothetical protein
MRALVLVEPGETPVPPDMLLGLLEAFAAWRDRWRPKMECFEFFSRPRAGWAVFNAEEAELSQALMELPLSPFSMVQVHPTVDGDDALRRLRDTMAQMMAPQPA